MTSREVKKDKMGDDPPYLAVGTDVSAKYKGAFCEAKVRKVVRVVKCKIQLKYGGVAFVTDDQIKGNLRIGTTVEVKLPDKKDYVEASICSIKDLSQYTVVFDDGDITTLRRTALCLKSGRHFAEGETLDQLPLTHPEHFSTPVIGASRRGRRRLQGNDDSSDDEDSTTGGSRGERQREADIGKVVCVEISEKKKVKDNWFPGLIVAPNAQDAVRIHVDEDYLVRSFKDGRYFTVPKKEATEFTREIGLKVDNPSLKQAVEKALVFLDKDELPPHWDRDLLFGLVDSDLDEDDDQLDSDSSDDEPREEKDHFVAQLYKFMDDRGTPINKGPIIQSRDVDLYRLFRVVHKLGGYNRVTNQNQWKLVTHKMGFGTGATTVNSVKHAYKKFLHSFEDFYRKLGCTMVNHPRGNRRSNKSNRSLIRDKDRATPVQKDSDRIKSEPGCEASSSCTDVKVEVKREDIDEMMARKEKSREFEAKRERQVKEEAQRRERTRDKMGKEGTKDVSKDKDIKEESIIPLAKKKIEETHSKMKVEDRPKQIGILAKFSYKKDKTRHGSEDREKDKDRLNRVKKSLAGSSGLMERQKRTIKETVKALAKTLGFGPKSSVAPPGGATSGQRKLSTSTSGEEEDKKKKEEATSNVSSEKITAQKRTSSGVRREDLTTTTPPPAPVRKSSLSGGEERSGRSNSRNKNRKPEDEGFLSEPGAVSSNPGETSDSLTLDIISPHKWISVGDKLRVYYGPNHKSKVTYEAKVLSARQEDGKEREYLVHYTGWNTRYDEWIRRNRIAENLTWNTNKESSSPGASGTSSSCSNRNRSTPRRSSTRTSPRGTRVNTDDSESDKESDGSESETETNSCSQNRSMRSRRILSDDDKKPTIPLPQSSPGTKTRSTRKEEEKEEEEDKKKTPNQEAERKSLRLSQRKKQEMESDSSSEGESQEDTKPKVLEIIEPLDDVYEFKEPEPFNFKQKKTISPPNPGAGPVQKGKKNIGLFEDYDNMNEENDDINAAIQRVMDTCNETRMDLDLLDSNSSDSNSSDSNSMCEIMKKRLQSEINTYEGPKSKLKGRGESSPTPPPMRTRRSSESKSSKVEEKVPGKTPVVRPKPDDQPGDKPNESVKNETDTNATSASKVKKSDVDTPPKTKKPETDPAISTGKIKKSEDTPSNKNKKSAESESVSSPKARKSDLEANNSKSKKVDSEVVVTSKCKKSDLDTSVASPKIKRLDMDRSSSPKMKKTESDSPIVSTGKVKKSEPDGNKTKKPDFASNTRVNSPKQKKSEVSGSESPVTKASKKSETPETNMKTRLKTESSPGSKTRSKTDPITIKTDSTPTTKPGTTLHKTDSVSSKADVTVKEENKTQPETKPSESPPISSTKQDKSKSMPVDNKAKVMQPSKKPTSIEMKSPISMSVAVPVSTTSSTSSISSSQTLQVLTSSQSKPFPTSESSPGKLKNISPVLESKKMVSLVGLKTKAKVLPLVPNPTPSNRSHDFSVQTELQSPLPKLMKVDSEPKPSDIPVLQRIECVLPKTPIKREIIDPSKIDLIKVSPNMPQLEKIDTIEKMDIGTPVKKEETNREDSKFPPFKFEDVAETPEKIFQPAAEQEIDVKVDKKIEFKMKPKALSPVGFSKRKLIKQKLGEAETSSVLKKYGPAPSSTSDKPDVESKDNDTSTLKIKEMPVAEITKVKDISVVLGKMKESTAAVDKSVSTKIKESPSVGINKSKEIPSDELCKDNDVLSSPSCKTISPVVKESSPLPSKSKDGFLIESSKAKETPIKTKDPVLVTNKEKDSTSEVRNKENTVVVENKTKEADLIISSKPCESSIVKETIASLPSKPEHSLELEATSNTSTAAPADDKRPELESKETEPAGSTNIKQDEKEVNKDAKNEEIKSVIPLEVNVKVEDPATKDDTSSNRQSEQLKTPEKVTTDETEVEKLDSSEDAAKKELSSVFEFDETLEDEIVDMESESYLTSSKRKLAALIDSPGNEFMSNKLAKLNELEKLKQKLFMDCSGESEDLEVKTETETISDVTKDLTTDETLEQEEEEEVDNTLLCKETIPGSPTPYQDDLNMIMELPPSNSSSTASSSSSTASHTAHAVLDNTPPTTPESSLSPPRNECAGSSSNNTGVYTKILLGAGGESPKKLSSTPMKRRSSTTERNLKKRLKQSPRNTGGGSDSDDLSMSETFSVFSPTTTDITKSKYSYFVELDPELDQAQRIAVVQQKLQDLRKEYMMYKQELVTIDRRRKKIRRRERENKKNSPQPIVTST